MAAGVRHADRLRREDRDVVLPKHVVAGDEREVFPLRLGDKHPVEWIIVVARQTARPDPMPRVNRELHEVVGCDFALEIGVELDSPQARLDGELP